MDAVYYNELLACFYILKSLSLSYIYLSPSYVYFKVYNVGCQFYLSTDSIHCASKTINIRQSKTEVKLYHRIEREREIK